MLTFDINRPAHDNTLSIGADLDQLRENIVSLMIMAASTQFVLAGWDTVITWDSSDNPSQVTMTLKGSSPAVRMRFTTTFTDGLPTSQVWEFDNGVDGFVTIENGTLAFSYDGSDRITGVTAS